ncbi:MAG TPA: hypothetical protein VM818_00930 [Vicinamibacterales bacterium]|nr:hypothetical protein [Vicinamibacterales bacterium]
MQALRSWSFASVLLVSTTWILVSCLLAVGWVLFQLRGMFSSGSGGIGAVAVDLSVLAIPLVPPLVLIVAWLIMRRF